MIGQGRPASKALTAARRAGQPPTSRGAAVRWSVPTVVLAVGMIWLCNPSILRAQTQLFDQPARIRIAWGGKAAEPWSGRISLDDGSFADVQLLGMEPDAAASVWVEGNAIHVASQSPHLFDGVDVSVSAPGKSRLTIEMTAGTRGTPVMAEIPLAEALNQPFRLPLDERGNELLIQRAPGDSLRIVTDRQTLIFAPGEQFIFDVQPVLDGIDPSTTIDIDTTLSPARSGRTVWNHNQRLPVPVDGPAIATLHIPLPREEGVYDVRLAVSRPPGFRQRFFPGGAAPPLVERTFQVLVLGATPPAPATEAAWQTVLEIDPASPRWWERLPAWTQIRRIPGLAKRPLGSLRAVTVPTSMGTLVELPPTPAGGEPHWQAYPLPLEAVGAPHLLEIEYPNDQEQHLGFSVVEPNAAGRAVPIGRDSGVYVEGLGHAEQVEKHKHRLVFWPRTNAPLLLVTNLHPTAPGRFGHVRVRKRTASTIARRPWPESPLSDRLIAAYLSRPLLPETFGATEGLDAVSGHSIDDWQSFYESANRLAEYLNYAGYNAAAVSVMADGSCIFSSERVLSTPLYNTSRMVAGASDLPSVDALDLLLRVFDRCGLALLPTLQFTAPLPELESLRRNSDPRVSGIEPVGSQGVTWLEAHGTDRGLAPYYNLLDDRVQRAMLNVVRELVDRYGRHPALAGLAVQLSSHGYAVVPDLEWGLDDVTVARFEQDTGIELPKNVTDRFAMRHSLLLGEHADAWRHWRATRVTHFYQQMAEILSFGQKKRRLLLTTEELFSSPTLSPRFRPNVIGKTRIDRAMLDLGVHREELQRLPGVVLCATQYVESMAPLVDRAVEMEVNDAFMAAQRHTAGPAFAAALFYHPPRRSRLPSFDAQSPFASHTRLVSQASADTAHARKQYAALLRYDDPAVILDGGELLPMGQEDATRNTRQLLQRLPTDVAPATTRNDSVTVRTYVAAEGTTCLVVNECPWQADVELDIRSSRATTGAPLIGDDDSTTKAATPTTFEAGPQVWKLRLAPYDVHAVTFAASDVQVDAVRATVSEAGQRELAARVADLLDRDLTASRLYAGLENPSFEPTDGGQPTSGWNLSADASGVTAELDATTPIDGETCLYLQNRSLSDVATIESNAFPTPPTGELAMTLFVRGENVDPDAELRIVFEAYQGTRTLRRFAVVGGTRTGAPQLTDQWQPYVFSENVPLDSAGRMRVGLELVGRGEIWIDHVQLYDLLFPLPFYPHSQQQKLELIKLIRAADSARESGNLSDCVEKLEGYWPRFLTAYTPAIRPAVAERPAAPENVATPEADKKDSAPGLGDWIKWPSIWRR